jgi:hypothetical protein
MTDSTFNVSDHRYMERLKDQKKCGQSSMELLDDKKSQKQRKNGLQMLL